MRLAWCLVLVGGCGRVDFATVEEIVIVVDPTTHHLGDDVGGIPATPEGALVTVPFAMPVSCTSATLELDFVGPWGPNKGDEPTIALDGADLGHVFAFFPPFTDPGWASGDYDTASGAVYPVHVALPCTPARGTRTFTFTDHMAGDDIFFTDVFVRCEGPY